ncbi:sigma-54-dependent Fis family transcriptional regulator [Pyxidicoccus parkwayensis]|uniref:Sigma-54-dependent Fis family transcriptional regulator n=1 Tax=Pyxidicoccus parkwayensis TaxID=2813578 RepID=A0ABX7NZB0_9BACT|nr:sigma 54-interacting transcriptional regulator [Pyxidicoccus parkwaysis]QSQ24266.1 sigma-54-dependent Fis family transcriptional regulator [Pyxidicoccus parkwaysis]
MTKKPFFDESTVGARGRREPESEPRRIPALTIVSHPVPGRAGERLLLESLASGGEVLLSRNAPDFMPPGKALGLPLAAPFLSRKPLRLTPGRDGGVRLHVDEDGTPVSVGRPVKGVLEWSREALAAGVPLELAERIVLLLHEEEEDLEEAPDSLGMVGGSVALRRVRRHISRVADLDVPVLIRGETGTGKELVARAIHQQSQRRKGPFISVNLGAIPRELATAELFGAHKGAYTGSTRDREGYFRAAHRGTLFLDEVGEAPPEVQVLLLRVLETGELFPVGASAPLSVDVRLIAATDAHLEARIDEGHFKAPLLHRLAGYEVHLPPLRERIEDLGPLFFHFAREELRALGEAHRLDSEDARAEPWLPVSLAVRLLRFGWPGNIRQLRNVTRQLIIGSRGQPFLRAEPRLLRELDSGAVPLPSFTVDDTPVSAPSSKAGSRRKPSDITEPELLAALRENAWDFQAAADQLGIPRPSVYDLVDRSPNIRTAGDLSPEEILRCHEECHGDLEAMTRKLEVSRRALSRRLKELGLAPKPQRLG